MSQASTAKSTEPPSPIEGKGSFEQLIVSITGELFRMDPTRSEEAYNRVMGTIAGFLGASQAVLYFHDEERPGLNRLALWPENLEVESECASPDYLPQADYSWLFPALGKGEISILDSPNRPPEAMKELDLLFPNNVNPLLLLPFLSEDKVGGFLGFVFPDRISFDRNALNSLKSITEIVSPGLERQKFEIYRAQSIERLNGILNSLEDAVWAIDAQKNQLLFFNPVSEIILGRAAVELFANPTVWFDVAHPEDKDKIARWRQEVEEAGQAEYEYRILRPDGEVRWLHVRLWMAFSVSGAPTRIDGIATDISERMEAQERLRSQQTLLTNLIENLQSGILVTDENRKVKHVNRHFRLLLGLPPDHLISADTEFNWGSLISRQLSFGGEEFLADREMLVANRELVVGKEMTFRDGKTFEQDFIPLIIEEQFKGNVWQFRDITPQKQAAKALQEAQEKEIEIAGKIQQTLLIGQPPKGIVGAQVASLTIPSRGIDGDFYDFLSHSPTCFDLIIGDVMGKGIPAALIGAATKSAFLRSLGLLARENKGSELPSPVDLANLTHTHLTRQLINLNRFITLAYARFDLERRLLTFVDCGHTKTLLYRPSKDEFTYLSQENCPMGFMEAEIYTQGKAELQEGDILVFYSDGLTEASNPAGEMFELVNLEKAVREFGHMPADHFINRLHQHLVDYTKSRKFDDDLTCVVVKLDESSGAGGSSSCSEAEFRSELENLDKIREFTKTVLGQSEGVQFDEESMAELILAVSESAANIMIHAYKRKTDGKIRVQVWTYSDRVEVWLLYQGPEFIPPLVEEPPLNDGKEGGFGLYLVREAVDEAIYDSLDRETRRIALIKFPQSRRRKESPPV